jgi:hypothetical protein
MGEAAAALAEGPRAHALRARAYAAELRALQSALVALLQASLDAATGALLGKAEDYSGEAKGVRELLCVDAFEVGAEALRKKLPATGTEKKENVFSFNQLLQASSNV